MKIERNGKISAGINHYVSPQICEGHRQMVSFSLIKLNSKYSSHTDESEHERVFLLLSGKVAYRYSGKIVHVSRKNCFEDLPSVLHIGSKGKVEVINEDENAEVLMISTDNENEIPSRIIEPAEVARSSSMEGENVLNGRTRREKRKILGYFNSSETNLFIGELLVSPGNWACYPPHLHREFELYFYKFRPQTGFAFSECGDDAYRIDHDDLMVIPPNRQHAQSVAPGYQGYILWVQRYIDGVDIEYTLEEKHSFMVNDC